MLDKVYISHGNRNHTLFVSISLSIFPFSPFQKIKRKAKETKNYLSFDNSDFFYQPNNCINNNKLVPEIPNPNTELA